MIFTRLADLELSLEGLVAVEEKEGQGDVEKCGQ
jgi:hypothetical protein